MPIHFGNDKIKEIYVGSDKIKEVYHGSEKVWQGIDGYWVHKDTGVKTYFGLDDPLIVDGIMSEPSWGWHCSEVKIPDGVTGLVEYCFAEGRFTSITLPESVTSLGRSCFNSCRSLTSITLPESLTSIGATCFEYCSNLESITIPESVTSIGSYGFSDCTSLTLATVLPATPPTLGHGAFIDVHASFNIKVPSPYLRAYQTATNWKNYSAISAI